MFKIRFFFSFLLILLLCSSQIISQDIPFVNCVENSEEQSATQVTQFTQLVNTTMTLKILLVEFSDVKHKSPGYTFTNFNNLFFSTGEYVSPHMYSPDGEPVFGSMNDYLYKMSDGNFQISGNVVNRDDDHNSVPDWLSLPLRKGQYDSTHSDYSVFRNAAITRS